jgi:hypothetical protein
VIFSAALCERILQIDNPRFCGVPADIDGVFWHDPIVRKAVHEQYTAKQGNLELMKHKLSDKAVWERLMGAMQSSARPPAVVKDLLIRAGAAHCMGDVSCSRERAREAVLHMHEIRSRPTVVDLTHLVGILPDCADEMIDEWLV